MVAVDEDVLHRGEINAGLFGELGLRAVLVEADHGGEAVGGQAFGLRGGDHAVCVGRIAHDGYAGIGSRDGVDDLALADEDLAIVLEQVGAFHAGAARLGADEQTPVGVIEADGGVRGLDDALEQREGAVIELHCDALEGLEGLLDGRLDQLEDDRLVGSEHRAGCDAEEEGVTDLAGGAGDCYADGSLHGEEEKRLTTKRAGGKRTNCKRPGGFGGGQANCGARAA